MEDNFEGVEVPYEIIEFISGGGLTEGNKTQIKDYAEWFKSKKYSLPRTQDYWVEHMRKARVNSFSEQEARDYIASIW